jgi:hypothetical protein
MATPQKTPKSGSVSRNSDVDHDKGQKGWGGYVDLKIDDPTKLQFASWAVEMESEVWALINDAVDAGLKFGIGWDASNQCYIASLTGSGVKDNPDRFCLTARSGQIWESVSLLAFKHTVMMNCDWSTHFRPRGNGFSWG